MTTLIFIHDGWTIMTASWTAGAKGADDDVSLHYLWRSALNSDENACAMTLPMTVKQFMNAVTSAREPVVDLRPLQQAGATRG